MASEIAEIVREMRECGADYTSGGCGDCKGFDCRDVRMFADRIEAAAKREERENANEKLNGFEP